MQSVKYEELIPMLLNEIQHQRQDLGGQIAQLKAENDAVLERLERLEGTRTVASR